MDLGEIRYPETSYQLSPFARISKLGLLRLPLSPSPLPLSLFLPQSSELSCPQLGLSPTVLNLLGIKDNVSSAWHLLNAFGPQQGPGGGENPLLDRPSSYEDDDKASDGRTWQSKDDWQSCSSGSVEDEESEDSDGVVNARSANILVTVHNVSSNGSFIRGGIITSWQKGKLLGSGSHGAVYKAFTDRICYHLIDVRRTETYTRNDYKAVDLHVELNDGFLFAVKEVSLLDQGSLFKLEQEVSLLSHFEHENVVRYLGTDKDDENLYIFLELMAGGSLVTIYRTRNLRDSQVSAYTRQILNGLKYLHDQNVVHRDIKCANILVGANESVKLADFGLAKIIAKNDVNSFKGSSFWMAPEVINLKNRGYGLRADIWSLGCTVLEMLTRQHPYPDSEPEQALFKIWTGKPPPVPDSLSRDAHNFIFECLQENPDNRPSAAQLLVHPFVRKPSSGFASLC